MTQAFYTIYDTALELAVQSIGGENLTDREFKLEAYRRAVNFSALLGDPEIVESLRYVDAAKVHEVRLVGIDEEGRNLLVCNPGDPYEEEAEKADGAPEGNEETKPEQWEDQDGKKEAPETEAVEGSDEAGSSEDGDVPKVGEEAEEGGSKEDEPGAGDTAEMERVYQRIPITDDGIFAADVEDSAPALVGKICLVWIGTSKPYSLNNQFCDLGGMAIRITEA